MASPDRQAEVSLEVHNSCDDQANDNTDPNIGKGLFHDIVDVDASSGSRPDILCVGGVAHTLDLTSGHQRGHDTCGTKLTSAEHDTS